MPHLSKMLCAALLAALTVPAAAQKVGQQPIGAPAVPQSHSVEQADARLLQVEKDRSVAEAEFGAAEQVCYTRFFVNNCLDKAKEKRRERLAALRAVEIEANHFKRKHAVDIRDRELEDRAQQDAKEEAARAAAPAPEPREAVERPPVKPQAVTPAQRQAEYAARQRAQQAQDAAEAPKRAERAAEHERRVAESDRRQQRVQQRLAEKEEKRRKRAEAEAAKQKALAEARARAGQAAK
jgi:colicin import membrane protein